MLASFQNNFMKGLLEMSEFVCRNCGQCCGLVFIVEEERKRIENYLKKHPSIRERIKGKEPSITCVFRDEEKGCLIYPCRPKICRAYMCTSTDWQKGFKIPTGSPKILNDCFGAGCSTEKYKSMMDDYLKQMPKRR